MLHWKELGRRMFFARRSHPAARGSVRDRAKGQMKPETIYVFLPHERVEAWAPVDAEHVCHDVYRIIDCRGEDEQVQFGKGALVRCQLRKLSNNSDSEDVLVAVSPLSPS